MKPTTESTADLLEYVDEELKSTKNDDLLAIQSKKTAKIQKEIMDTLTKHTIIHSPNIASNKNRDHRKNCSIGRKKTVILKKSHNSDLEKILLKTELNRRNLV